MTIPPPTPNSPLKTPAAVPTIASFSVRARGMRAILDAVSPALTLPEALATITADPVHSGVLLDVDGTLAPIVRHADDAQVPEATRTLLIAIAKRYGLVACVSGRRAATARRIVSIGSIAYIGNHGGEVLMPGSRTATLDPDVVTWTERIREFAESAWSAELQRLRVRFEDKEAIAAFHWRGAPDDDAAAAAVRVVADRAESEGFATHWGRKVLEVRPPVQLDKGRAVASLVREAGLSAAVYVGDDVTDVDAFLRLRALVQEGELRSSLCVGVRSDETPPEIDQEADLTVDGPEGVRALLKALLD
jgi:trehalose 6-phosphate phosphatase